MFEKHKSIWILGFKQTGYTIYPIAEVYGPITFKEIVIFMTITI